MAITFGDNQYGKAEVRLVHVTRDGDRHQIRDLNVSTALRGDFAAAHLEGDNAHVVATDTQKNTVYALAQQYGVGEIEAFALRLGRHFTDSFEWVTGAKISVEEYAWDRIVVDGTEHGHAFSRAGGGTRTTAVTVDGPQAWVVSGLTGLVVLKSTGSEFTGFPRDRYTSLAETTDRILATAVTARWRYAGTEVDWAKSHADVRRILLEAFAGQHSLALQQTLYAMGEQVLQAHPEVAEIRMSMPNKHHFLVDLSPFGLPNDNEVYYAADRPYGLIEGTVTRDDAPDPGRAWQELSSLVSVIHVFTRRRLMTAEAGAQAAEPRVVVNGRARPLGEVGGHVTLLEWLRADGLTGVKEGCAEGECGACAVLVAREDGPGRTRWDAINACLVPAAAFDQQEVVTAEGLGRPSGAGRLHPVQREMAERGGSQCGYCTPGFICSMAAEYYRPGRRAAAAGQNGHRNDAGEHGPNGFDLHALSGNLCRCTGYRPIRDAAYALGPPQAGDPLLARLAGPAPAPAATATSSAQGRYVRPAGLAEALGLLAAEPDARLVAGSTDWGVELNIRHARAALSIGIDRITELREFSAGRDTIDIGAALSLSEIEARLAGRVPLLGEMFPQFASRLIRNGATLGGNLGTASPIGDAPPALLALDASLVLASSRGEREVQLAGYFTGYRQSVRRPDELIKTIRIPLPAAPVTAFHKIAKRRFDDISSVAVAYALRLEAGRVVSVRIGLGGVAATPLRALAAEEALTGQPWTRAAAAAAAAELARAGTPMSDHRASEAYRIAMLRNSLLKFFAEHEEARP